MLITKSFLKNTLERAKAPEILKMHGDIFQVLISWFQQDV